MIRRRGTPAAGGLLAALLAGCTAGPDFHVPAAPVAQTYRAAGAEIGTTPRIAPADSIAFDWWRSFGSPAMDDLVGRALANSPQIMAAQARLRVAQATLRAGYGVQYPAVSASFDAARQQYSPSRVGGNGSGSVFSLFTPSVAITYALDLFGANRRAIEGLKAQVDQQQQIERGTYLTLAASVVSTAIARAAYHDQVRATEAALAAGQQALSLARTRAVAGVAPYANVLALEAQVEAARSGLAAARQKAEQADDLLAILVGETPDGARLPAMSLNDLHLPASIPLTLPAQMVRQRPDILAALAAAHAANANVGTATAAMLPDITLSAGLGTSSNSLARLFAPGSGVWNLGASVAQPLFAGGALRARKAAAQAGADAALADYRQTVLNAFAQVADTLAAIEHDGEAASAEASADQTAESALHLTTVNRDAGIASESDVLASRALREQARANAIAARAAQLQDCVALYAALGGGWWK